MKRLALCLLVVGCHAVPTAAPTVSPARATPQSANAAEEIGLLRNARVALPRGDKTATLTFFAGDLSAAHEAEIARIAPHVHMVTGLSRDAAIARAGEAQAIDARFATPEFLRAAHQLVWIQAQSAGVERYLAAREIVDEDRIVLTNMRATSGPAIADHAFAMLLALTRGLVEYIPGRAEAPRQKNASGGLEPIALQGRTLLVLGLGGIGSEIARRGHGFGMRVLALRRSDDPAPDFVERVGKPAELHALLAEADVVAVALPLTNETEHLLDRAAFDAMKRGSYLVNVARGKIVDTDALVDALKSGRLAGACLDVTDPEPLPKDHPLRSLPNVILTPHVAARADLTEERAWALFCENLRRFDAGEPLLNVVDKHAGY